MGVVSYLLDTHVLLWWLFDDPRLSGSAAALLAKPENRVVVSAASAWEISTKFRLGKLPSAAALVQDLPTWLRRAGFEALPISVSHAERAGSWDVAHRDPFDRMLAAQSFLEGLPLITSDRAFSDFGIECVW
ncbi:MAG: type II toxin-antitoxin system VapC family toxin [Acidobacteria bacterium]|nr:type II toxin-antitoxin system VapC family toxin [Acidobacteriota bacterium]